MAYFDAAGNRYDEAGYEITAFGARTGRRDPNVAVDQPLSAIAATKHTTVAAVASALRTAALNPAMTTRNPVMLNAERTIVGSTSGLPIGLIALAVGAYLFYRYA